MPTAKSESRVSSTPRRPSARGAETSSSKPQGWGAVAKRQADIAERREQAENSVREFWLKGGETSVIQFLQDEPYCYDAHQVRDRNGKWTVVPCQLGTQRHCVLCSEGVKRTWKAAFMLLDYRGSWDKDKKEFTWDKPVVRIWKVGSQIAQQLKTYIDRKGKNLSNLVLEVTRSGEGKDSSYNFGPAFDKDDNPMKPIHFTEKYPSAEELCQPPTDDQIDEMGFTADDE